MASDLPRPIPEPVVERTAERLRVLGQPIRIRVVERLEARGEMSVQALADELNATQQNISRHLNLLAGAGVLTRRQEGRTVLYKLADPDAFSVVHDVGLRVIRELREAR